jgi:eukaryotic translation initiation factor 2C
MMLVGVDATHPSPESSQGVPSCVGIIASIDAILGQWPAAFAFQEWQKEILSALESLFCLGCDYGRSITINNTLKTS